MDLEALLRLRQTLLSRVEAHRAALQQDETRTRYSRVDPLLRALGWDLDDPGQVVPEFMTAGTKRADYALLGQPGASPPAVFVEAKKLRTPLQHAMAQSIGYCIEDGVRYFAVTDGMRWEIYDTHKPVPMAQKKTQEFEVSDSPNTFALSALWLWRGNHLCPSPAKVEAPQPPRGARSGPQPTASAGTRPEAKDQETWTALPDLHPQSRQQAPRSVRFRDGTAAATGNWKNLLVAVARYLAESGRLSSANCPVSSGRSRFVVSSTAVHSNGRLFAEPVQVGEVWVETLQSAFSVVANVKKLLAHVGERAEDYAVGWPRGVEGE